MEGGVDNDGFDSDEDLPEPIDEPQETQYLIVKRVRCKAQQERQLEEWFDWYPVAVDGVIYQQGEWNDPALRSMEEQLPPWLQQPVSGSGWGRPRGSSPSPGRGIVIDHRNFWGKNRREWRRTRRPDLCSS